MQLIVGGDLQDLIYCKRRESCRTANKNRLSRFSGSELIRLELFESKSTHSPLFGIGLCFKQVSIVLHNIGIIVLCAVQPALYDLKFKVNAVFELLIVLTAFRSVYHVDQRFKVPLIFGVHSENKCNIRSIEQFLRFHPKVIAGRLLRGRSILDKDFHEFKNILLTVLLADICERIIVHRLCEVNGVEHLDLVRLINRDISAIFVFEIVSLIVPAVHNFSVNSFRAAPFKHLTALYKHCAFRIGHYIGGVHLHQVRLHKKSCLTRTRSTYNENVLVTGEFWCRGLAHCERFRPCEDHIVFGAG